MTAVETYQAAWELEHLVSLYRRLAPATVLEIGSWKGGTLWHWLQLHDTTVVSVDDAMRGSNEWHHWALESGSTLHTIQGDSRHPAIVDAASEHGPYAFIFIDADHTYEAVHADWMNYRTMIAEGGAIAFHDILERPGYGVSDVWREVKEVDGVRWIEICQNRVEPGNEGRCGIGVAWLP